MKRFNKLILVFTLLWLVIGLAPMSALAYDWDDLFPWSPSAPTEPDNPEINWDDPTDPEDNYLPQFKSVETPDAASLCVKIYRVFNTKTGEHLYTPEWREVYGLIGSRTWNAEGIGWYAPTSGAPVYRLFDPRSGNHLYTTDTNEVQVLTSQQGWRADNNGNPMFFSGGAVNVFRLFNPGNRGLHHLTTDEFEYNAIPAQGWIQEGISFQAVKAADGFPNEAQAYNDLLTLMLEYPEGTPWSYENTYTSEPLKSGLADACHAFALMASDRIFGYLPGRRHNDVRQVKVGDIVRYKDPWTGEGTHTVCVLEVEKNDDAQTRIICAEGNWAKLVRYGRRQSLTDPSVEVLYIWTRYP